METSYLFAPLLKKSLDKHWGAWKFWYYGTGEFWSQPCNIFMSEFTKQGNPIFTYHHNKLTKIFFSSATINNPVSIMTMKIKPQEWLKEVSSMYWPHLGGSITNWSKQDWLKKNIQAPHLFSASMQCSITTLWLTFLWRFCKVVLLLIFERHLLWI